MTTAVVVPCWVSNLYTSGGRNSVNVSHKKQLPLSVDIRTVFKFKVLDTVDEAMPIENTFVTLLDSTIVHCPY